MSREIRVPPPELERWRRMFLEGACEGLKGRKAPDGELMLRSTDARGPRAGQVQRHGSLTPARARENSAAGGRHDG